MISQIPPLSPGLSGSQGRSVSDRLRWVAVGVFVLSSTLNYLDRNLLSLLAPLVMAELQFNQEHLGWLVSAFSFAYAAASLGTGWMLDRFGVNRTISLAVGWWSAAAVASGLARSFGVLVIFRGTMGVGESAGVPAAGKLNGLYLRPEERALGAAVNQIGLALGSIVAPLWIGIASVYGWRSAIMVNGALGFVWIPIWLLVSRFIQPQYRAQEFTASDKPRERVDWRLLGERNLLLLVAANVLWMSSYSLWSVWTTLYLMHVHHLKLVDAGHYVWIPPMVSTVGGFFGGWLSLRWMRRHIDPVRARRRAVWVSAVGSLVSLGLFAAPDAAWATFFISMSFFFALAGSVNIYALPIDIFGPQRSGLALAALTFAFGLLQTVISPIIGFLGDHNLYPQVAWMATVPLLLSAAVLMGLRTPAAATD